MAGIEWITRRDNCASTTLIRSRPIIGCGEAAVSGSGDGLRARLKGRILNYKEIALMSDITPFSLSSEIELSVEGARQKWGSP